MIEPISVHTHTHTVDHVQIIIQLVPTSSDLKDKHTFTLAGAHTHTHTHVPHPHTGLVMFHVNQFLERGTIGAFERVHLLPVYCVAGEERRCAGAGVARLSEASLLAFSLLLPQQH